jgi:hypothetical protein
MEIQNANDRTTYMTDLDKCQKKMVEKGFTDQFQVTEEGLKSINTGHVYSPADVEVPDFFRFEGVSDPDDMSILYVIQTNDGDKGTLVDAYGLYADDQISSFMAEVDNIRKKVTKS